jgi:hypothetical protein
MEALTAASRALATAPVENRAARTADVAVAAAVELAIRAERFLASLADATDALRTTHAALVEAATPESRLVAARKVNAALIQLADHGIDSSYPLASLVSAADAEWVAEQARLVLDRLRQIDAPTRIEMHDGMSVRGWTERASQVLAQIAGERFPIMLALVFVPEGELASGLARQGTLEGADLPGIMTWLRRLARVRPSLGEFHDLALAMELRDGPAAPTLRAVQAPSTAAGEPWAVNVRPGPVQRTVLLQAPAHLRGDKPLCGWLIDAWTERIPGLTSFSGPDISSSTELAGLTFHYNQPDARAPHTILIAVPPDASKPWTGEMLLHILQETFDLARIRSVEHRDLPRRTPIVPTTYVLHGALWPMEMDPHFTG